MIKTVLIATDGSSHARKAEALAADLANKFRARLVVVHVRLTSATSDTLRDLAKPRMLTKEQRTLLNTYDADMRRAYMRAGLVGLDPVPAPVELLEAIGSQILARAKATAAKAGVKKATTAIKAGDPADAILDSAMREKAGLIVMGTRGLGGITGLLLGSVSHKVASHARCPVLTVK